MKTALLGQRSLRLEGVYHQRYETLAFFAGGGVGLSSRTPHRTHFQLSKEPLEYRFVVCQVR